MEERKVWKEKRYEMDGKKKVGGHVERNRSRSEDPMIQPGKEKNKQKHRQ